MIRAGATRDRGFATRRLGLLVTALVTSLVLGGLAWPRAAHAERPPYHTVRYVEDWSSFERDPQDADPTDRIKNIQLGSVTSLSVGGQLRLRAESYRAPDFGLAGGRAR